MTHVKGKGLDFEGYRAYQPDDDAQYIDWKASLRAQELLVKVFTEERNVNVLLVLDTSASMCFSSVDKLKCEYAAEVVANIAFSVIQVGDSAGLLIFNDDIKFLLEPNQGKKQFYKIIKALSNPNYYDGGFNFKKVMDYLNSSYKKKGVIIFVSDFIGLPEGWYKDISRLALKNDIIFIMIRDPRDDEIPESLSDVLVVDPYSDEQVIFNCKEIKKDFELVAKEIKENIKMNIKKVGGKVLELRTDEPFDKKLIAFFSKKR